MRLSRRAADAPRESTSKRPRSPMQLGMIGLGRMGNGMTDRLREHGHDVKTYDPNVESRTAASLEELRSQLDQPRAFWLMVPAGKVTEDSFQQLLTLADGGDTIVDGGNS